MIKRTLCFLCTIMICLGMVQVDCCAAVIDPTQQCSLTLTYARNGKGFSDLKIDIYRVAELRANGEYKLLAPFSGYPIKIHGITSQQEWQNAAQTIKSYVTANQVEAYRSQKTDSAGVAFFPRLETGLYMVSGTTAHDSTETVVFHDFMIYLPTPVENDYDYDVEAKPKYTEYTQSTRYTVMKLWSDAGASGQRPESVDVEILKDGVVYKRVILNSANNWMYHWDVTEPNSIWSVIEKDVPNGYQVSIANKGTAFIITNSKAPVIPDEPNIPDKPDILEEPDTPEEPGKIEDPDSPKPPADPDKPYPDVPKTGDTTPLLMYAIILCVSGFGLITLGVLWLRERRNEKKR